MSDKAPPLGLSNAEISRYSRHLIMPEVGMEGQLKLKQASVLLIGAGGLGSPLALYLAAAGVGRIGLVDFDVVDASNLQRQIMHAESYVGRPKLDSARERLTGVNPHIQIDTYEARFTSENAAELVSQYDIVADGTDNFPTRYLVNDACVMFGKPNVYGSIFRFEGQASVFNAGDGPCYRCLYPEPPPPGMVPSCAEGGVLGVLPGIIGTIQALEVIKLILGQGDPLIGRLLLFDALGMSFRELKLRRSPKCPICSENPSITEFIDYEQFCGISQTPVENYSDEITVTELDALLKGENPPLVIDVREPHEYEICHLEVARLIPLGQIAEHLHQLSTTEDIIVHCKSGARSRKAVNRLKEMGFARVKNLQGGILAWAREIDESMPLY